MTVKRFTGSVWTDSAAKYRSGTAWVGNTGVVRSNGQWPGQQPIAYRNRPANPAAIVYGGGPLDNPSAWAKPGALIIAGRGEYTQSWVATVANGGGTVIMYLDAIMRNTTGRYHSLLFNASQFGPAVPTWPGNPTANQYGPLADFRVGSVLQNKLPGVLQLILSENPNISGIFLDDCGSRSWFPGFNWGAWSSADKEAYRAGAIRVVQTTREVVGNLFVMVNGTWGAQSSSGIGDGGYPVRSQHGISLADGGFWENHSFDSYGVAYGKSLQWGSATVRKLPYMWFSNVGSASTRDQWVAADCCAFASSTFYNGSGAPWKTTFTDFGLPS